ncbi:MAG: type II toxin-antitoxin system VapC family toxin [Actinobacteria bacterium]|nr:type II toxin-antitoxin system VapC family toxin [Actinomycetota bacterium]
MKVFFDTSVLIAAFVNAHPRHSQCFPWILRVKRKEITGIISAHSLLESYSVLTSLPLSPRISSKLALSIIKENIISVFKIINYTENDYQKLLGDLAANELSGGSSYDGLLLHAAKKCNADKIITLNLNDFIRAAPELIKKMSLP